MIPMKRLTQLVMGLCLFLTSSLAYSVIDLTAFEVAPAEVNGRAVVSVWWTTDKEIDTKEFRVKRFVYIPDPNADSDEVPNISNFLETVVLTELDVNVRERVISREDDGRQVTRREYTSIDFQGLREGENQYAYWIEEVENDGSKQAWGPKFVTITTCSTPEFCETRTVDDELPDDGLWVRAQAWCGGEVLGEPQTPCGDFIIRKSTLIPGDD